MQARWCHAQPKCTNLPPAAGLCNTPSCSASLRHVSRALVSTAGARLLSTPKRALRPPIFVLLHPIFSLHSPVTAHPKHSHLAIYNRYLLYIYYRYLHQPCPAHLLPRALSSSPSLLASSLLFRKTTSLLRPTVRASSSASHTQPNCFKSQKTTLHLLHPKHLTTMPLRTSTTMCAPTPRFPS